VNAAALTVSAAERSGKLVKNVSPIPRLRMVATMPGPKPASAEIRTAGAKNR
jgi:hypothetical protein